MRCGFQCAGDLYPEIDVGCQSVTRLGGSEVCGFDIFYASGTIRARDDASSNLPRSNVMLISMVAAGFNKCLISSKVVVKVVKSGSKVATSFGNAPEGLTGRRRDNPSRFSTFQVKTYR